VLAGPGVPLERDAAGHARVMQLVELLGVVAHEVNIPGRAGEAYTNLIPSVRRMSELGLRPQVVGELPVALVRIPRPPVAPQE
jgi:hypothetical protein